jgi:hypothetical protein
MTNILHLISITGPCGHFLPFFLFTIQPTFLSDPRKRSFLNLGANRSLYADFSVWEPTGHFVLFFTNISVLPTQIFAWGPTVHFMPICQFGSPPVTLCHFLLIFQFCPRKYLIWGPTVHFMPIFQFVGPPVTLCDFLRSELEAPLSFTNKSQNKISPGNI